MTTSVLFPLCYLGLLELRFKFYRVPLVISQNFQSSTKQRPKLRSLRTAIFASLSLDLNQKVIRAFPSGVLNGEPAITEQEEDQ